MIIANKVKIVEGNKEDRNIVKEVKNGRTACLDVDSVFIKKNP